MYTRLIPVLLLACTALVPATAVAQQTINLSLGVFTPRGADARVARDVLNANSTFLLFDVGDFKSASIGGEWLVPFGEFLEGGIGVAFSRRTVRTVYTGFTDNFGGEIEQELRLRQIPFSFTVRALPLGQSNPFQPYIGAGLVATNWRYAEFGDFVDFGTPGFPVFPASYVASGTATGPVVLAGVRFGGHTLTAGGEVRYHKADAELTSDFAGASLGPGGELLLPRIDLGGWTYNFTIGVRFGR
jgi:hypothetical protein